MTPLRAIAAALFASALLPAAAQANATVTKPGTQTVYQGTDGVDDFSITLNNPPALIFQRASGSEMDASNGCSGVTGQEHTRVACGPGSAVINLNGGADKVLGGADGYGMTFNGGGGDDTVSVGSTAVNAVNGGDGDDSIMAYGPNGDPIDGGAGNDTIRYPSGPDDIRGGGGTDLLVLSSPAPVTVSLDDAANDAGGANVHADVEHLTGAAEADTFTGSAAANVLTGGQGNDTLDGAGGADTVLGGEGDDTISARDGAADTIDCGVGNDTATVDALDTVSGCETVLRPDDDLDGSPAPIDCNDHSPAIRPGAGDTPGDGIDQDCSGADTPAPPRAPVSGLAPTGRVTVTQIVAPVRNRWLVKRRVTKVTAFSVSGAPAGGRVTVTCEGKGCPFAKRSRQVPPNGKVGFTGALDGHRLKPGAVIEVRITARGWIGKVVRYTVRKGKLPKAETLCLAPGASKPGTRC